MMARAAWLAVALLLALAAPAGAQLHTPTGISLELGSEKWIGDLDGMVKRRMIRVLTPYNHTHYFIDKGIQRGLVYDQAMRFEEAVNKKFKTGHEGRRDEGGIRPSRLPALCPARLPPAAPP